MMHGFWIGFWCGVCSVISVGGFTLWLLIPWKGGAGLDQDDFE
jgi:hypothetical protein